jgi:thymidine kinase
MFSGKTEELIRRLRKFEEGGSRVAAAKPSIDDRAAVGWLVSHADSRYPAHVIGNAEALFGFADGLEVLGLDEIQFFDVALSSIVEELRAAGVRIVAAGLDLDFRREPFPCTRELRAIADTVETLTAVCERCGRPATLTQRVIGGLPAPSDDLRIRVGGHDLYEARCETCYFAEEPLRPRDRQEAKLKS